MADSEEASQEPVVAADTAAEAAGQPGQAAQAQPAAPGQDDGSGIKPENKYEG